LTDNDYRSIIPHEHVIFRLAKGKSPGDTTLRSAEWAIITQIDGKKTISQIAEILSMSHEEAINLFIGLFNKGIIELHSTKKIEEKLVDQTFFETLERELTGIVGPVAPFLISDAMAEMDSSKNSFSRERITDLIELISDDISDDGKRIKFQIVMLDYIKNLVK
jgi:hypothetical protein